MENKYYEEYWKTKQVDISPHLIFKKNILAKLKLKGQNYLDIGCGNGYISEQFTQKFETYGLDISAVAIEEAEKKGLKCQQINANSMDLPFTDAFFDNIVCLDVLEHLTSPEDFTKEIFRVLKKGGSFVVCVPNLMNIFNRLFFLKGEFVDVMDVAHRNDELFSEHIKMFSKKKLELLLHRNNFEIIEKYNYFPEKFSEAKTKRFQLLGDIINKLSLPDLFPELFALGFLYVCRK